MVPSLGLGKNIDIHKSNKSKEQEMRSQSENLKAGGSSSFPDTGPLSFNRVNIGNKGSKHTFAQ